uniref:Transmembrane protein n=1 Tax=Glossina palpalis gambiensis TaxID=67801 RepID=A0A1B0C5K5_9MUSC
MLNFLNPSHQKFDAIIPPKSNVVQQQQSFVSSINQRSQQPFSADRNQDSGAPIINANLEIIQNHNNIPWVLKSTYTSVIIIIIVIVCNHYINKNSNDQLKVLFMFHNYRSYLLSEEVTWVLSLYVFLKVSFVFVLDLRFGSVLQDVA